MTLAGIYTRVVLAWLIAMQPMLGAYAAAHATPAPLRAELCRGAPVPSGDLPASASGHPECCLAACGHATAPPPEAAAVTRPRDLHPSSVPASAAGTHFAPAGRGLEPARAPPV